MAVAAHVLPHEKVYPEGDPMPPVPKRVSERLIAGLKRYQPILDTAKSRDVNESDTSMIVSDMLADLFGYDKYNEITRELCVRGTYCDLAIRVDDKLQFLIEVKAIGVELKDQHVKQGVDYAANQGIEWVALTNGIHWKVFRVTFGKPIDKELVVDLDFASLSGKNDEDVAKLFLLSRESIVKSALEEYHDQKQATNKFVLAAAILSDPVLGVVRRQLRRMSRDLRSCRRTTAPDVPRSSRRGRGASYGNHSRCSEARRHRRGVRYSSAKEALARIQSDASNPQAR
jgi:hypothetical protein